MALSAGSGLVSGISKLLGRYAEHAAEPPVGEAIDEHFSTWWDFKRIKNIPDEYSCELAPAIAGHAHKYLFFADYSLWCWAWAISCADDESKGCVALIGGASYDKIVASSFSDFVQKYISDWQSINIGRA